MNIAVVSDSIYPYNKGGKEKRIFEIMTRLARRGHRIDIYTMKWWDGPVDREEDGMFLHGVVPLKKLYTTSGRRSIWQALWFGFRILPPLLKAHYDVLDVDHMPFFPLFSARIVATIKRRPLSATWHEVWGRQYWNSYLSPMLGWIAYLVERLSTKAPTRIISDSVLTTSRLVTMLAVPKKKIVTMPIGINVKLISNAAPRSSVYDVIFFGRLLSHKHVDDLIRVIQRLQSKRPSLRCLIIGNGPERQALEILSRELGLQSNVEFKDFLPKQEDVYGLLRQSKLFISLSTREGFGLAPLEAMAAGVPVIIVDHPDNAVKEFVTDGLEGRICPLQVEVVAEAVDEVLSNPIHYAAMSAAAEKRAASYDIDRTADAAAEYFKNLLSK